MSKRLTIFKSQIGQKRKISSGKAWNSGQKSDSTKRLILEYKEIRLFKVRNSDRPSTVDVNCILTDR